MGRSDFQAGACLLVRNLYGNQIAAMKVMQRCVYNSTFDDYHESSSVMKPVVSCNVRANVYSYIPCGGLSLQHCRHPRVVEEKEFEKNSRPPVRGGTVPADVYDTPFAPFLLVGDRPLASN